jgi:uncharacterized protein YhaN
MKIQSLYIDGFGKFHDWKPSSGFGEGLTVIEGPNEAGKTTLLDFIRRMLYGFPDGRTRVNHYPPLRGGKVGGRLEILGDDGREYILSRSGVRGRPSLTYGDGTVAGGLTVPSLLGSCDQIFYENVCAIGLGELQEFSTLGKDEIRDRLAAAGAGNLPIREVTNSLAKAADAIYLMRGKTKEINNLLSDLKDIEEAIRDAKRRQGEYDAINEEITHKIEAARSAEKDRKAIDEEITYLGALGQAWEVFTRLKESRDALQAIPVIKPFSADALEKLGRIEDEVRRLEEGCRDLAVEHSRLEGERERCVVREEVLSQAGAIRTLERKIEQYRNQTEDLREARLKVEQQRMSLDAMLKSFGGDWDEERILRFDTSVPARDVIKQIRDRLAKAVKDCDLQQSRLEVVRNEADEKRASLSDLQGRRDDIGDVADQDTARRRLGLSRDLLSEIQHIQSLDVRLGSIRQEEARTAEIKATIRSTQHAPSWPGVLVAVSAIFVFVWGFLIEGFAVAGAVALLLLVAAAGIFLAGRKVDEGGGAAHDEGETLASQRGEIERERFESEERIRSHAALLGLDSPPTPAAAGDLVHTLEDTVREADRAYDLDREIVRAGGLSSNADAALAKALERMDDLRSIYRDAQDAWVQWCRERGLPETTNPELIPDLIADIRRATDLCEKIRETKEKQKSLSEGILSFEDEIATIARACNESPVGSPEVALEGLIRLLCTEEEEKRRYGDLVVQLNNCREALDKVSLQHDAAKENLEALLGEHGAGTPEEYREFERLSRERQDHLGSIRDAESAIKRISGEDRYHDFIAALQVYDPVGMKVRLQEIEKEVLGVQDTITDLHQEIGGLKRQCSEIEGDSELTHLLSREAALREEINQVSRKWAVYTTASSLLDMAVETFERERQPEILQEAQLFFTRITGGRYTRVVRPLDGSDLYIEGMTGAQRKVDELSRGTAEQLYLALRFGYIRDYVNSSIPVPIVFDDILVNFDPVRRKNACRAIADLVEICQVLYFTCHPQTVADLVEAIPGAVVMDISK